jgi:phosphatidylglycerophosphate synthase
VTGPAAAGLPPLTYRKAVAELLGHQKTNKGGPAYSRYVNRPIGRRFAAIAYLIGLTPNQVTGLSALCTFSGIAVIALCDPSPAIAVSASALLVVGYALDAADGQLARLRGGGSVAGEWLDHVVDAMKIATLHLAVLVQWHEMGDRSDRALLIPLAFQVVSSVLFFTIILNDQIRRAHRGTTEMLLAADGSSSPLYSLAVVPTDYGLLCVVFALQWWETGFTWAYGALLAATATFLLLALGKWFREMRSY